MKFGCDRPSSFRGEVVWNCGRTDDGRTTDDGRRTTEPAYTISSPGAFGSGELKMLWNSKVWWACPCQCWCRMPTSGWQQLLKALSYRQAKNAMTKVNIMFHHQRTFRNKVKCLVDKLGLFNRARMSVRSNSSSSIEETQCWCGLYELS